ncbi:hypothetical protein PENTCL1PPCAC_20027 [Pristionchus entomophagus]|uniref:Uncharacterized protein n=1 Tax=Pristionchus entomophagus TaxID=358040 RepID=A0AAV5TUF2_9BILA|nr:hypothetical protein PENTCL1PPCAC_20027 [Pristionchus entomophagus]
MHIREFYAECTFFLAIANRKLAVIRSTEEDTCGAQFDLSDEIIDHGAITKIWMGELEKKIFRVKLSISLAFRYDGLKIVEFTVDYDTQQKKLHFSDKYEKLVLKDGDRELKFCPQLDEKTFFGVFDDTVVKSDGLVTRNGEISSQKRRRIAVVGRELWHGKILMANENGSIRVVKVNEEKDEINELSLFSKGECVPPYCTLRCREPTVI